MDEKIKRLFEQILGGQAPPDWMNTGATATKPNADAMEITRLRLEVVSYRDQNSTLTQQNTSLAEQVKTAQMRSGTAAALQQRLSDRANELQSIVDSQTQLLENAYTTIAELREVIRDMQFVQPSSNSGASCAGCSNMKHWGCSVDCPAAKVTGNYGSKEEW